MALQTIYATEDMQLICNETGELFEIATGTGVEVYAFKQKEGDQEVYLEVQWFDGSRFRLGHASLGCFRGDRPTSYTTTHGFKYKTQPKELVSSPCS